VIETRISNGRQISRTHSGRSHRITDTADPNTTAVMDVDAHAMGRRKPTMLFERARRPLVAILLAMIMVILPATSAQAATPTFGYRYQNGVGNITAWLNYSSGVGDWEHLITGAANNWMYPGWDNPIYVSFVGSNVGSTMDFHQHNDAYFGGGMNTLAHTSFFSATGGAINPASSNWTYAEVHINDSVYSSASVSNDAALGTTIHEMGHAFGLAHYNTNRYSIMCQTGSGRIMQRVAGVDNDAINYLY